LSDHHDAVVREQALEVLQSITSDYAVTDEPDPATTIFHAPGSNRKREDRGNHR
jgi:hypothetical protein